MYTSVHCIKSGQFTCALWPWPRLKRAMSLNKTPKPHVSPAPPIAVTPATAQDASPPANFDELLQRVGATRDRAAFAALFGYYAPRVKSYMLKNGLGEAFAEEVVQNTFVTVWEKAASYDPRKAAASTWIFTIARNKRIDALRRDKNLEVNSDSPNIENAYYDAEEQYADRQDVERLNTAIDTLPPEQAELLRMAFFEEKSHSDISNETKLPLGTVKSRLRLAMDKLRNIMTGGKHDKHA